jgi:hypothetical protein
MFRARADAALSSYTLWDLWIDVSLRLLLGDIVQGGELLISFRPTLRLR